MKEMFEFPLRRTYELLLEQIQQARGSGKVDIKVSTHIPLLSRRSFQLSKTRALSKALFL